MTAPFAGARRHWSLGLCSSVPNIGKGFEIHAPNHLWVVHRRAIGSSPMKDDVTYLGLASGSAYLAAIMGAWSRRIVGSPSTARSMPVA